MIKTSYVAVGGLMASVAIGSAAIVMSNPPGVDRGGAATTEFRGLTPNPQNDMMKAVGKTEADRRAGVNRQAADERGADGRPYVAGTVIAEVTGPQRGELPEDAARKVEPAPAPVQAPPPEPRVVETIVYRDRDVVRDVYRDLPTEPKAEPDQISAINEQIKVLLKPTPGGFLVREFAKGERPKPEPAGARGPVVNGPFGPGVRHGTVARSGDVAYAVLDRGFNSDDPGAPIFATITDLDELQRPGPLEGIRLMGQIVYSQTQASIRFTTMILQDGRQGPMQAVAITVDQARTGVAADVDNHVLERYGSLVVAGLIQGVGQVGQQLTQLNTNTIYGDGYAVQSGRGIDWMTAGMGATLPVGQALTAAAARNFSKPPTLSSPTNFPIGIVFLQPVVLPLDAGPPSMRGVGPSTFAVGYPGTYGALR